MNKKNNYNSKIKTKTENKLTKKKKPKIFALKETNNANIVLTYENEMRIVDHKNKLNI